MKSLIKHISNNIKDDLNDYNKSLINSIESNVKLINTIVKYILNHKGKTFRPILCILSSRLNGTPNQMTYLSAATVEILHVATLLHDDVVDDAEIRRGWPTVNKIWNNKLTILVGDYMFSKSLKNISLLKNFESIEILSSISERLSEGEILQIENAINKNISEEVYFKMVKDKTASLLGASCKLGYISSSNDENKENIQKFGEYLGIAYQLKDDLFDVMGKVDVIGKKSNLDLKKNMLTLPYIHMLNSVEASKRKEIISKLKYHYKKRDLKNIKLLINRYNGIEYTEQKINEYTDLAFKELNVFEDSLYKDLLIDSLKFNNQRNF